jgi:sugar lactone lactonase YvrE
MKKTRTMAVVVLLLLLLVAVSVQARTVRKGTVTTKVLVRGAALHGANGVTVDDQGLLYVASVVGQEIVVMDPQTGKILERFGPESGVVGPDDVVFGPDGSLYWTDIMSGEVGRRTPDGQVDKQYVADFVNPLAFNAEGRLFVAQAFLGDGLYEVDPDLQDLPVKILGTGDPSLHLNGFAFGPDGLLYAPRQQLEQIVRINVDTAVVEIITDDFEGSCAFDSQGQLYAASDERVYQIDPQSGAYETVVTLPEGGADNLAFDADDTMYVTNFRDGTVYRILPNGRPRVLSPGGLMAPGGIAVLPDEQAGESIYIADFWTVRGYDGRNGKPGPSGRDFFFDSPFSASADGQNLILTSWFGGTVEVWSPDQNMVQELYYANVPLDAVRFQGDFAVSELGSGSVVKLESGTGNITPLADELLVPAGLAVKGADLWAADWATGIIWQIVSNGTVLDPPEMVATGLAQPEGLAVDHDGSLLVVESGEGRVSRIDPATGTVSLVAEGLALGAPGPDGWPPTWLLNDLAVGQSGDIYVTGDIGNVVYRLTERP